MLLFVYGTLKQGFHNHYILKDARFITKVTTKDKYPLFMLNAPFPYLQNDKGIGNLIAGELYFVKDEDVPNIDFFEGAPVLYYRENIDVSLNGLSLNCFTYFKSEKENLTNVTLLAEFI